MGSLKSCLDKVVSDGLLTKSQRDDVSAYFRSKAKEMAEEGHEGSPTERHIEAVSELLEKVKTERESILKQAKVTTRLKPSEANVEPSSPSAAASSAVAAKPAVQKGPKVSQGPGSQQARGGKDSAPAKAKVEPIQSTEDSLEDRFKAELPTKWSAEDKDNAWLAVSGSKDSKPLGNKLGAATRAWGAVRPKEKGSTERDQEAKALKDQRADTKREKSDEKQIAKVKSKIEEGKTVNDISPSELKKWADDVVKEGNLNVALNPRLLAAHAIRSADWIAQNGAKFAEWSKAMLKDFGQAIGRHLQRIWKAAKEAVAEGALKWLERTGGIKYMSDNTGRPAAPERPAGRPAFSKWQDMGVGDIKLQAEALDNAWKAFRGQGKAKKLTDAQIEQGWAEEIANPDSPFITSAVEEIKAKQAPEDDIKLFSDPVGFQLVKSSVMIAAREAGSLARFTSRIVKQFGSWIAEHAKALWTAAAKGAEHVGEYLKGVVQAAKKTSQVGAISPGGTVKVPSVSTKGSSPSTKAKTNTLLSAITDILKAPGDRTPSGLLVDRSKMGAARKLYHNVVGNPVDEARRIHKVLGAAMEHMDFRSAQEAKDYETLMNPSWTKVFKKLGDQDTPLRLAYLRGDVKAQHDIVRSVAGDEGVKLYEQAIENFEVFYEKAQKAGLKLNKVGRYLPTRLKAGAYPELLNILAKHGLSDDISRVLKKTNKEIAGMDAFEAGEVMQGALSSIFGPAGNRHFKSRTGIALHAKVMDEIAPLYETFDNVIGHYGVQLTDAIVRAEMLGPDSIQSLKDFMNGTRSADTVISESSPLGLIVEGLRRDGEINAHDLERLKELVSARMGYLPDGFVEKWLKSGNMSFALANPFSAIRQPGTELVKSLFQNGVLPTLLGIKDAVTGKGLSVVRDLFLSPDFEIGQGNDPIKWINQKLSKLSGFRAADLFPANVMANAALRRLKALSRDGRIKELSHLKDFLSGPNKDASLAEVADKIGRGEFNDPDVWRVAWHEVTKLRPTGLGTRPIAVLRNRGLARVAANLKEWGLRNVNFMKEATYDNLRSGDPEKVKLGLQGLSLLVTGMVLAGASGDALVDWLLGKDVQFDEKVKDNVFKMGMASRYQLGQVMGTNGQRPSVKDALLNYMSTPTLSMIDSLGAAVTKSAQDDEKSFMDIALKDKQLARIVPLGIGTAYFAWSGESGESDRAKQVESRLPDSVLQLTEEASKLRALGEDGRKKSLQATRRWSQLSAFAKIKSWRTKLATEAAKMRDYGEAEAQLGQLEFLSRSPHLWAQEAERIAKLKAARERLYGPEE